ncbi:MAG: carotenoid biosynthesis protein [Runella slithyformis]|nr:MAG: carotenoid biosynthesis protein [Runella slithyformis]TAE99580.1 MAG: carotenoid biosynthesis protein [Runella slithyformis]TAF29087.1 MAG: carotenoid biosynthesis protein [Runella slithyformis]TAF48720.1 MAG: carotenoid biosynthesis protein [Runella slithyformis]TAF80263.1 MAG: carotenoid biosynthesis protein [Runella slithyformis]
MVVLDLNGVLFFTMKYSKYIFVVVPLMHLAGFVGAQFVVSAPLFRLLTPFHLLTCLVLLLLFHQSWNAATAFYCFLAFVAGFFIEVVGVHTGLIFGSYRYGNTLGYKALDVPLLIGANWLVLTYCVGTVVNSLALPTIWKAACAATVITALDVLIEPVAIRNDFWSWQNNVIPFQNYAAWFLISWVLLLVFYILPFAKTNRLAIVLLLSQLAFFGLHNLLYLLE